MFKSLKWEDWSGIVLGMWMLVSPWVIGFSDYSAATMNALVMGTVLVLAELLELSVHETAEEWLDIVAGLWLLVSPVALGFTSSMPATVSTVAVGFLTVLFAALALSPFDDTIHRWLHDHMPSH
jgi:SPW repeat-containing protein